MQIIIPNHAFVKTQLKPAFRQRQSLERQKCAKVAKIHRLVSTFSTAAMDYENYRQ